MKLFRLSGLSCFLLLTFLISGGCKDGTVEQHQTVENLPKVEVSVAKVLKELAANQVEIVGTIQAVEQAQIAAKISGNIVSLSVDLGSRVKKGDLLIKIKAGEISAKLQLAEAQLEQGKRNLAREKKLLAKKAATPETVKII